jgi:hypothetical protein
MGALPFHQVRFPPTLSSCQHTAIDDYAECRGIPNTDFTNGIRLTNQMRPVDIEAAVFYAEVDRANVSFLPPQVRFVVCFAVPGISTHELDHFC